MKTFTKVYAGLTIIMVICAASAFLMPLLIPPLSGYSDLVVEKLQDKPEKYFVVTNPDPVLSQAISSGGRAPFHSFAEIQIDDLMNQYGTNNIEYQNNYYWVGTQFVEVTWSNEASMFFWLFVSGFIVSLILLASIAFVKGGLDHLKKQKEQQPQALT